MSLNILKRHWKDTERTQCSLPGTTLCVHLTVLKLFCLGLLKGVLKQGTNHLHVLCSQGGLNLYIKNLGYWMGHVQFFLIFITVL
mgnify:CR=1 FL=1